MKWWQRLIRISEIILITAIFARKTVIQVIIVIAYIIIAISLVIIHLIVLIKSIIERRHNGLFCVLLFTSIYPALKRVWLRNGFLDFFSFVFKFFLQLFIFCHELFLICKQFFNLLLNYSFGFFGFLEDYVVLFLEN